MRIFRYIVFGVLVRGGVALLLLTLLYVAIDFVETGDRAAGYGSSYFFRLPMVISHMLPIALVLGVQAVLAGMRSHGEWGAFLAAGIAPVRLGLGLLVLPVALIPIQYGMQSVVVPRAMSAWHKGIQPAGQQQSKHGGFGAQAWCKKGRLLVRDAPDRGAHIVISRGESGSPLMWKSRGGPESDSLEWRVGSGWKFGSSSAALRDDNCSGAISYSSGSLTGDQSGPCLTNGELLKSTVMARSSGHSSRPFETEIAMRIALALACLVVPLLGLAISIRGDESRYGRLIGAGLFAVFVFWLVLTIAWNGALAELWSPLWVSVGVPLVTLLFGLFFAVLKPGILGIIQR